MSSVGAVYVDVFPSALSFGDKLRGDVVPQANAIGEQIGKMFAEKVSEGLRQGVSRGLDRAPQDAAQKGASAGGAFADTFKAKVEAALKALPDVKVGVDASEADRQIAELRARLLELSGKTVGVDIDPGEARAELERIKAALECARRRRWDLSCHRSTSSRCSRPDGGL